MTFQVFTFKAETLCLGERIKGGLHRPCARTLRYSTITSALRHEWGDPALHAVGVLDTIKGTVQQLIYSPTDRVLGVAKVPLTIDYLAGVEGRVFLPAHCAIASRAVTLTLGAFRSKGFGRTELAYSGEVQFDPAPGRLAVRIPKHHAHLFGIEVIRPVYGYLWEPDHEDLTAGRYVLSLVENTLCTAPACLLQKEAILPWTLIE